MNPFEPYAFPAQFAAQRRRARSLAWLSVGLLSSAALFLALTVGSSQAMKTAWVSDVLSIIPPVAAIVAARFELRPPTRRFPYGYTRAVSVAFLVTAAMLTLIGLFLFADAAVKLIRREHPSIGSVVLFGHQFWAGWLMVASLSYSLCCGMLLGVLKKPVAAALLDRELQAEVVMNTDEWASEGAAIVGIVLVSFGWWWADAASAAFIAVQIIRDGWDNVRQVIGDLIDEAPNRLDSHELEDLPEKVRAAAAGLDWAAGAAVRLREHGRVIMGDVFVIPRTDDNITARIERARQDLLRLDWRLHSLTVMPVKDLPPPIPH